MDWAFFFLIVAQYPFAQFSLPDDKVVLQIVAKVAPVASGYRIGNFI